MSIAGRFIGLATVAQFISDTTLFGFKSGVALALSGMRDELAARLRAVGAEQDPSPLKPHRTIEGCLAELPDQGGAGPAQA